MSRKQKKVTSLWSFIETMQRRLEHEGLEEEVVDAAVARRLELLLRERYKKQLRSPFLPRMVIGEA
jgi:hypothetical protein